VAVVEEEFPHDEDSSCAATDEDEEGALEEPDVALRKAEYDVYLVEKRRLLDLLSVSSCRSCRQDYQLKSTSDVGVTLAVRSFFSIHIFKC
jgi:hypothetical protein